MSLESDSLRSPHSAWRCVRGALIVYADCTDVFAWRNWITHPHLYSLLTLGIAIFLVRSIAPRVPDFGWTASGHAQGYVSKYLTSLAAAVLSDTRFESAQAGDVFILCVFHDSYAVLLWD